MDSELRENWYRMSVYSQISNIGSEVNRALNWKNKGNDKRAQGFCTKAIQFLQLTIDDDKNRNRRGEFSFCIEELIDYFFGNNLYNTKEEQIRKYYDAFINYEE